MVPYIIGGVLLVLGALLAILVPMKIKNKNIEIRFMQTTPVEELKAILAGNAAAGLEGYRHYVELTGLAEAEKPLKAPFSEKEVAYYNADLYQVYEEKQTTADKSGSTQTVKKSEAHMASDKSTQAIVIKDKNSPIKVFVDINQSGLQLDTLKTFDRFEPLNNIQSYGYFNNYRYNNMGAATLGFRMSERTIPLGQALYALGEAKLENDRILLQRPSDKKPFIVSVRGKSDIVRGNKSGANAALVFGIIIAVAGILLMIFLNR
ncbi:MAG: hypothetical protein FJW68_07495 [Actinobacteria bacterium]|nr:hypothetical protein [Actinomycetota bacterium]